MTLSSCAVTSAGVKKGDERNVARSIHDVSAERVIQSRMARAYDYKFKGVDVEVKEGIAVLTGNVPTQKDKVEAERIAWSAQRIQQVGNEIFIKDRQSNTRNIKDGLLEKSVRARLVADKYVKARNLNVETHDGNVYLLGVARNQAELERAAKIASTTKGAREIISYVTVAGIDSKISQLTRAANAPLSAQSNLATLQNAPTSQQRELPSFLTPAPQAGIFESAPSPYQASPGIPVPSGRVATAPLSAPIPFASEGGSRHVPQLLSADELGKYRIGVAGETVSTIESEPYYIDPKTGKEIPVSFIRKYKK